MEIARFRQSAEDNKISRHIYNEAWRILKEQDRAEEITIGNSTFKNYIVLVKPYPEAYMIHDEATAKYLDLNIHKEVMLKVAELRKELDIFLGI